MSRLAGWFRRAMGHEVHGDSDAIHYGAQEGDWAPDFPIGSALNNPDWLTRHGLALYPRMVAAVEAERQSKVPANLRLTPEARSAAVARGNVTRRLKREMTEKPRSELRRSVEGA